MKVKYCKKCGSMWEYKKFRHEKICAVCLSEEWGTKNIRRKK